MFQRIQTIPGKTYACGCDIQPDKAKCPTHDVASGTFYVYTHRASGQRYLFTAERHSFYKAQLKKKLTTVYDIAEFADRASAAKAAGTRD